jgi:hypothetical protein
MASSSDEFQDFQSNEDAVLPFSLIRRWKKMSGGGLFTGMSGTTG